MHDCASDGLVLLFSFVWWWLFGWVVWWCVGVALWFGLPDRSPAHHPHQQIDGVLPLLAREECLFASAVPLGPIVYLLGVVFISPVSPVAPAAKGTCLAVVFCLCGVFFVVLGCFCWFSLCLLLPFTSCMRCLFFPRALRAQKPLF